MRTQWSKFLVMGVALFALILAGCTSDKKEIKPKSDEMHAKETTEREKMISELIKNKPEPAPIQAAPGSAAYKRNLLDQIYQDLMRYNNLNVPPIRDARTDELINRVLFDFDKANLRDEYTRALSDEAKFVLAEIERRGDMYLQVEGHADNRGSNEYNLTLGHKRANSVNDFLKPYSTQPSTYLKTVSFGEEFPSVEGNNEAAWSQNRRVIFTLMLRK